MNKFVNKNVLVEDTILNGTFIKKYAKHEFNTRYDIANNIMQETSHVSTANLGVVYAIRIQLSHVRLREITKTEVWASHSILMSI